jgi:ubiquinone/menaquinone biosynthesis C-methylase UbiE
MAVRTYQLRDVDCCEICLASINTSRILGLRLDRSQGLNPRNKTGAAVTIHRCTMCDFVYSNPEPRPASLNDHYNIPVESYWNADQLSTSSDIIGRHYPKTKQLLDFTPGMKALDIGAGVGRGFLALKQAGFDTWAIEPSPSFRAKALEVTGATEDRIGLSSVEEASFPESTFDFVSFGSVFEHLYNPDKALERSMKWVRPGGIWYAEVPSADHLIAKLINAYFRLIGVSFVTNLSPMSSPFHIHEFTKKTFEKYQQRSGTLELCAYEYEVCSIRHFPRIFLAYPLNPYTY